MVLSPWSRRRRNTVVESRRLPAPAMSSSRNPSRNPFINKSAGSQQPRYPTRPPSPSFVQASHSTLPMPSSSGSTVPPRQQYYQQGNASYSSTSTLLTPSAPTGSVQAVFVKGPPLSRSASNGSTVRAPFVVYVSASFIVRHLERITIYRRWTCKPVGDSNSSFNIR